MAVLFCVHTALSTTQLLLEQFQIQAQVQITQKTMLRSVQMLLYFSLSIPHLAATRPKWLTTDFGGFSEPSPLCWELTNPFQSSLLKDWMAKSLHPLVTCVLHLMQHLIQTQHHVYIGCKDLVSSFYLSAGVGGGLELCRSRFWEKLIIPLVCTSSTQQGELEQCCFLKKPVPQIHEPFSTKITFCILMSKYWFVCLCAHLIRCMR